VEARDFHVVRKVWEAKEKSKIGLRLKPEKKGDLRDETARAKDGGRSQARGDRHSAKRGEGGKRSRAGARDHSGCHLA